MGVGLLGASDRRQRYRHKGPQHRAKDILSITFWISLWREAEHETKRSDSFCNIQNIKFHVSMTAFQTRRLAPTTAFTSACP